jgi:PhnB protein
MTATPLAHLNFAGQARAALDFYAAALGGQVAVTTYADAGMPAEVPGSDRVVFGQVLGERGPIVMAYDVPGTDVSPTAGGSTRRENHTTITDQPVFLALGAADLAEAEGWWAGLADGGTVVEPLAASAWSAGFGMVTDRFGVTWIVQVAPAA